MEKPVMKVMSDAMVADWRGFVSEEIEVREGIQKAVAAQSKELLDFIKEAKASVEVLRQEKHRFEDELCHFFDVSRSFGKNTEGISQHRG